MHLIPVGLLSLTVLLCGARKERRVSGEAEPLDKPQPEAVELIFKHARLYAEVARTPERQALGLAFRTFLHPDSGMVFVFQKEERVRFWMKNTYIPLAIAFVDKEGVITDIMEMVPLDTVTPYEPSRRVAYAIEANTGWFVQHGVQPGDTVRGLPPYNMSPQSGFY